MSMTQNDWKLTLFTVRRIGEKMIERNDSWTHLQTILLVMPAETGEAVRQQGRIVWYREKRRGRSRPYQAPNNFEVGASQVTYKQAHNAEPLQQTVSLSS